MNRRTQRGRRDDNQSSIRLRQLRRDRSSNIQRSFKFQKQVHHEGHEGHEVSQRKGAKGQRRVGLTTDGQDEQDLLDAQ